VVGIGNILIAFLILPLGWAFALIAVIAAALAGVPSSAWNTAFTEDVYEALLCLFYEQLDAQGHIDQSGWDALLAQAYSDFPDPNVGGGLELVFKLHGVVGLNNAGSAYADPGADCGACACTIVVFYPWANIYSSTNGYNDCDINPPNCVWRGAYVGFIDPIGYTTEWDIVIDLGEVRIVTGVDFAGASTGAANVFAVMDDDGVGVLGSVNPPAGYETGAAVTLGTPHETQYLWLRGQGTNGSPSEVHVWLLQATIYVEC